MPPTSMKRAAAPHAQACSKKLKSSSSDLVPDKANSSFSEHSAATKVMNDRKLAEKILRDVDFITLLRAEHLNKTCNKVITSSEDLPKKLFKLPVSSLQEADDLNMIDDGTLLVSDPDLLINEHVIKYVKASQRYIDEYAHFSLNDKLVRSTKPTKKFGRSWEAMFLCQPPLSYAWKGYVCMGSRKWKGTKATLKTQYDKNQFNVRHPNCYLVNMEMNVEKNLKAIRDDVQKEARDKYGYTVDWEKSQIYLDDGTIYRATDMDSWNENPAFDMTDRCILS